MKLWHGNLKQYILIVFLSLFRSTVQIAHLAIIFFKSRTWFRVLLRSNLLSFFLQGDHESTKGCLTSFRGLKATGQADRQIECSLCHASGSNGKLLDQRRDFSNYQTTRRRFSTHLPIHKVEHRASFFKFHLLTTLKRDEETALCVPPKSGSVPSYFDRGSKPGQSNWDNWSISPSSPPTKLKIAQTFKLHLLTTLQRGEGTTLCMPKKSGSLSYYRVKKQVRRFSLLHINTSTFICKGFKGFQDEERSGMQKIRA